MAQGGQRIGVPRQSRGPLAMPPYATIVTSETAPTHAARHARPDLRRLRRQPAARMSCCFCRNAWRRALGASWMAFGVSWAPSWGVLGGFGGLSGGSWGVLVGLGAVLGDIWGSWAASGVNLKASWAVLRPSWRPPGPSWGGLGRQVAAKMGRVGGQRGQDGPKRSQDRAKMANRSVIFGFLGVNAVNHEKQRKTKEFLGNP